MSWYDNTTGLCDCDIRGLTTDKNTRSERYLLQQCALPFAPVRVHRDKVGRQAGVCGGVDKDGLKCTVCQNNANLQLEPETLPLLPFLLRPLRMYVVNTHSALSLTILHDEVRCKDGG